MIQLSYDPDGVTLEFRSRQTLLNRLLSRPSDRIIDHDQHLIERVRSRFILTMVANNLARLPRLLAA